MIVGIMKRPFHLALLAFVLCSIALVGILAFKTEKASADACSVNGRDCYFGYFFNGYDGGPGATQHNVISAPALLNVNHGYDFVETIRSYITDCNNSQNATGAAFIVLTMLGAPPGTPKNVACQRFLEWEKLVYNYEASGLVNWNQIHDFGGINTRSTYTDVAYYPMNGAASSIVFYSPTTGLPIYAIKRDCANPIGKLQALTLNYDLTPTINATVNGTASTGVAEAGDTITFNFGVNNSGSNWSPVVPCNAYNVNHTGYFKTPATPESGGSPVATTCPKEFPPNSSTGVGSQTVTATANTTVCRTLFVSQATPAGATKGTEVCIAVASKPYLMVFGGDVAAGGDVETAPDNCATNNDAAIVSWNKGGTAGWAGAGTQHAAYAMGVIKDFSTTQYSPAIASSAEMPSGLAFANTTKNVSSGIFGGNFGTAKCIKDYYGQKPANTTAMPPTVSSMTTGAYAATTSSILNGANVNPGQKITVYVDGDLYISSNITYAGSWSYNNIPLFQMVVRGNIFVASGVTRLDGVYIAQPNGSVGGNVYTCATDSTPPFDPPTLAAGAFYSSCTSKLTVNGSLVARNIQFLRTSGTLRQSSNSENSGSNNAAEVFNYGPGAWITQPDISTNNEGRVDNYDAITSLPPVL